jgi:hypothetical protein
MRSLVARAATFGRKWWAVIAAALALAGVALAIHLRRRRPGAVAAPVLEEAVQTFERRVTIARTRAVVERAAARAKSTELRDRLEEVLSEPDLDRQAAELIALDAKVRAER